MPILDYNKTNINIAANDIKSGNLVAFPTETVYGLGANALDSLAVSKIFATKKRPSFNPLIVHFHSLNQLKRYFELNSTELLLAKHFWPGALTLVLQNKTTIKPFISELCSGGLTTQAVRIPNHTIALELLLLSDVPIAAPSANLSNTLSPIMAKHVELSLQSYDFNIIDGGKSVLGIESTILEVTELNCVNILRYGSLDPQEIANLGITINNEKSTAIKAPGNLKKHYSPKTKLILNSNIANNDEALLAFGVLPNNIGKPKKILNLSPSGDLHEAAANLFAMLWELDLENYSNIVVMPIPTNGLGIAINERLEKAAAKE
ncbi:L-threonylcarbamoyladenylate synthase [Rickettsiales bacterium LUAb2]